jgi:DNA-binding transcriptional MocR family regulator
VETIDFAGDEPHPDLLPVEELADCAATALGRDGKTILSYGAGAGYTPLRELVGRWFGTHPFNVVLTNGWLQGLALLAAELLPNKSVATGYPTDTRALATLLSSSASIIYLAADDEGLLTSDLEQQLIQYVRPALIYVTPSFASPTGATMPEGRRRHLIELLDHYNHISVEKMHLLEDDSYALTRFEGERLPALHDLSWGRSLYSSSFSATVAPGLRVGWLILPDELAGPVARRANDTYITPALLGQATVFEFIRRGSFEPHLLGLRERLRERRDAMLASLAEHLPDAAWSHPEGGYFVWLELPGRLDGRAVVARAEGVTAAAGTEFGSTSEFLRLSFASPALEEIAAGVERLAAAVHQELEARQAPA